MATDQNGTKRVVSKQTKLLFIAFGAASIATVCVVYREDSAEAAFASAKVNPAISHVAPAHAAK